MSGVRGADAIEVGQRELDASLFRNREEVQHGVGRSAGRGNDRNRVLDRLARDDVSRFASELRELHHLLAHCFSNLGLLGIGRRHAAAAEHADAERLGDDRHRVRGELTAAGARAGTRDVFDQLEIAVVHAARRVRADRFEHVLNRHLVAVELTGRNRSAVEHDARARSAAPAP